MDKKVKTTLIVALSLFGAGVIIWLAASLSVNFDYSKLSTAFRFGGKTESSIETEFIEKDLEATSQEIWFQLSSADVTVTPSADDKIHISYTNTEDSYFELDESSSQLILTQKQNGHFFFGFNILDSQTSKVTLSLPVDHEGNLKIDGASSDISMSELTIEGSFKINSVSGEIAIENCKAKTVEVGSTSGEIELSSIETDNIRANTVSGNLKISEISQSIFITLASTSGEVYAENTNSSSLGIESVSGDITLRNVAGQKTSLSTTSGSVELSNADFSEVVFNTVSGDIRGTVSGAAEDYTVFTSTVSGSDNLSAHRGRGDRTLSFSSTSGDFEISFEK